MPKIVLIGAGSGFGARLSTDIMATPSLTDSTICLCDIHEGRLHDVTTYVQKMIDEYHLNTKLESSTDRTKLLPGADYVITSISVGGGAYYGHPYSAEIEIPRKYGIEQTVADTYSVGATFRLLRTAPVQLQICRDMEKYCPNALLLNHTNPMVGLVMVQSLATKVKNVGLCHGVQGTAGELSALIGKDAESVDQYCAGINHLAWFLDFKDKATGEDLYPKIHEALASGSEKSEKFLKDESVRCAIMDNFGYFPTESNHHDSEYLPYFRRTKELLDAYHLAPKGPVSPKLVAERAWARDGAGEQHVGKLVASKEYTIGIINAIETGSLFRFNGNVMNTGLITNLPTKLCVEVPCLVDKYGIHPTVVGDIPTQLAGFDRSCATPVQLAVEAILERDRQKAFYAIAQDVNAASMLSLPKLRELFEEMWAAEGDLLEWFDKGYVTERCAIN